MPLVVYRRHNPGCSVHQLGLTPAAKRLFLDCKCQLWISGSHGSALVPRQSLGTTDLRVAEAKRRLLIEKSQETDAGGISIRKACQIFLDGKKQTTGEGAIAIYSLLLRRLTAYCESRGISFMDELTLGLLDDFPTAGLPKVSDSTRAQAIVRLRAFLRAAWRHEWIKKPLGEQLTKFSASPIQKQPFTDAEVERLLAAAQPVSFRLLLELMLETGMRVSDAVRFDPSRLQQTGLLWRYNFEQHKRRRGRSAPAEVYISDRLKQEISAARWLPSGKRPGQRVWTLMAALGRRCNVANPGPHRLRHTFAVRMLRRGVPMGDVSRLLGHSSLKITEAHYAAWVPERSARLASIVAQALMQPDGDALGNAQMGALTAGTGES